MRPETCCRASVARKAVSSPGLGGGEVGLFGTSIRVDGDASVSSAGCRVSGFTARDQLGMGGTDPGGW